MGESQPAEGTSNANEDTYLTEDAAKSDGANFWVDECLSPRLVGILHSKGHRATCNRDRALLGAEDEKVFQAANAEDATLITNNELDFRKILARSEIHAGLIVVPHDGGRNTQSVQIERALEYAEASASKDTEPLKDWLVDKCVKVEQDGSVAHFEH